MIESTPVTSFLNQVLAIARAPWRGEGLEMATEDEQERTGVPPFLVGLTHFIGAVSRMRLHLSTRTSRRSKSWPAIVPS